MEGAGLKMVTDHDEEGLLVANPKALEALGIFDNELTSLEYLARKKGLTLEEYLKQAYPVEQP